MSRPPVAPRSESHRVGHSCEGDRVTAMVSPSLAFMLAFVPGKLAGIDASRALLERLLKDAAVTADRELKHAVEFATKSTQIERKIALSNVEEIFANASKAGVAMPALPLNAGGWPAWGDEAATALAPHLDASGVLALRVGQHAFELLRAWSRAERIAYLRAARAEHSVLVEEAAHRVTDTTTAWRSLEHALVTSGRPLLEVALETLNEMIRRAPPADAVKVPTWSSAFSAITSWIEDLEENMGWLARDLDVPIDPAPRTPPTPEEEQLVAEIIANPDDDELRVRFAELAAARGDVRAELVREQLAEPPSKEGTALESRQRIDSHPEWSAPLIALGARDLRFTRGFPSEITIDLDALIANAEKLFALAPITVLRISGGIGGRGRELAAVRQLAQLYVLDLSKQGVTDSDLQALLDSSFLARLRTLTLHQNPITDAGVEALVAATPAMPALRNVDLQLTRAKDPSDRHEYWDDHDQYGYWKPTERGKELEATYGRIRWFHADE